MGGQSGIQKLVRNSLISTAMMRTPLPAFSLYARPVMTSAWWVDLINRFLLDFHHRIVLWTIMTYFPQDPFEL